MPCPALSCLPACLLRRSSFVSVCLRVSFCLAFSPSLSSTPPSRPVRVSFSRPLLRLLCLRLACSLAYSHLDLSLHKRVVREFRIRCSPDLSVKDAALSFVISVSKVSTFCIASIGLRIYHFLHNIYINYINVYAHS